MDFATQLQAFINNAKAKAADGLNLEEAFSLLYDFIVLATSLATSLKNPGTEKREIVLDWVAKLFDAIAPLVTAKLPVWLWWYYPLIPIVRPINRQIVLAVAAAILERVYPRS